MHRAQRFEWDRDKARQNLRKHRVSFEDAAIILADPFAAVFHLTWPDARLEYGAERWVTLGSHPYSRARVLYIVWAPAQNEVVAVTRIVSARAATRRERHRYEKITYRE